MLTKTQIEEVQKVVDKEVAEYLHNLPDTVRTILRQSIISLMGLKSSPFASKKVRGTQYQVDSEKSTWLTDHLRQQIGSFVEKSVKTALNGIKQPRVDEIISACNKYLIEQYQYQFRDAIRDRLKELAKKQADAVIDRLDETLRSGKSLADLNRDLNDPESHPGKVGEYLLEIEAKRLMG